MKTNTKTVVAERVRQTEMLRNYNTGSNGAVHAWLQQVELPEKADVPTGCGEVASNGCLPGTS